MIGFFRKIRKKLADENKPMKYLRYAVGEIFLVVIGILIALQINNWNEERKIENTVDSVLLNLKKDIHNDIYFLKNLDSIYNNWHVQAASIETTLHEGSIMKIDNLDKWIVGRGSMNHLSINTATFDQMKNTGLLYNIKKPKIANSINEYYAFAEVEFEKINFDNQEFYKFVLNTSGNEYILISERLYSKTNLEYLDWSWLNDPGSEV